MIHEPCLIIDLKIPVSAVHYLPNGRLLCGFDNGTIKIYNYVDKVGQNLTVAHANRICQIVDYSGQWFISGDSIGKIVFWNSEQMPVVKVYGHNLGIISLKTLRDKTVASYSWDGFLKVWDLFSVEILANIIVDQIDGADLTSCPLSLLPNGHLITISTVKDNCLIRILNPRTGNRVKGIKTRQKAPVCTFTVLPNYDLVIALKDGSLKVINLYDQSFEKTLICPTPKTQFYLLNELPKGHILYMRFSATAQFLVFDSLNWKLVQTLDTNHSKPACTSSISPDQKYLVVGFTDGQVKEFSLEFNWSYLNSFI